MANLVACPCCARHIRPTELACPFCGLTLEQASRGERGSTPWYALAALSSTLVLAGCPMMAARYGGPPVGDQPARVTPTPAVQNQRETVEIYGAPPPPEQPQDAGAAQEDPGRMVEAYGAPPPPNTGSGRDR